MGDYRGRLRPLGQASLLYLDVRGTMSAADIATLAGYRWTELEATIATSDLAPGIYPKNGFGHSFWVVHQRAE